MKNWSGKKIVVSGGSKGLGLEIARAFGEQGASIILLARNEDELQEACNQLQQQGVDATFKSCDVVNWEAVEQTFQEILAEQGQIDVLINAVGKSTRCNIESMDLSEAREMMDVNYFSALHCVKAALPSLQKTSGSIVNIGSLSSKTAWPYMTPYTASKHALAALSHQLRIELKDSVHSMLVCPGPIKREDAGTRYDSQSGDLPGDARKPGGGAKLKGVCPAVLAKKIVRGCELRKAEIIVPWKSKLLFVVASISTRLGDWLLRMNKGK